MEEETRGEIIKEVFCKALGTDFEYAMLEVFCNIGTQLERLARAAELKNEWEHQAGEGE